MSSQRQYMMESRFNGLHAAKIALLNVMLHIFSHVSWLEQVFWNKHFILLHFVYLFFLYVWRHMSQCLCGGQRTICGNQVSLSIRRILGTELRLWDLEAGAFIYWDVSLALKQPNLRVPSFYDKNSKLIFLLIVLQEHPAPLFEIPVSLHKHLCWKIVSKCSKRE